MASDTQALRIGELARLTKASADTLRFYERRTLLSPARRTPAGYRLYDRSAIERVAFIRKAQLLGLSLDEVREVLRLAGDGTPPCAHVRERLAARLAEVEARLADLGSLRATLRRALERQRRQPVARKCVCEIIESQALTLEEEWKADRRRSIRSAPSARRAPR